MRVRGSYTMGQAATPTLPPGLTMADLTGSDPWNRARVAAAIGQPDVVDWTTLDADQTRAIQQALSNVMTTSRPDPLMSQPADLSEAELVRLRMKQQAIANAAAYQAEQDAFDAQRRANDALNNPAPVMEMTDAQRDALRAQVQADFIAKATAQGQTVIDASGPSSVVINQPSAPSLPRTSAPSPAATVAPADYSGDGFSVVAPVSADFPASQGSGPVDSKFLMYGALALLGLLALKG